MQSSLLSIHPFSASCRRRRRVSISLFKRVLSYEKIKSVLQCYLTDRQKHEEKRRKNGDGDNCNDGDNDNDDKAYNDVDHDDQILIMMMMMMMTMMTTIHIYIYGLYFHTNCIVYPGRRISPFNII